jgi:DNA polymerase delta subunit 2
MGTAGQNIKDIRMFSENWKSPVDILEHSLIMRHSCPTSPDTLRSYSFTETDPFIISDAPHVYFAGNQPIFGSRWVNKNTSQPLSYPDDEEQKDDQQDDDIIDQDHYSKLNPHNQT